MLLFRFSFAHIPSCVFTKGPDGNVLFKIFGNVNLTLSDLGRMFVGMVTYHVQHWPYTFPDLSPVRGPSQYQPVRAPWSLFALLVPL